MDPLFLATVEAVEEAVLNAMMKAETMTGINNTTVEALPYDRLRDATTKSGQWDETDGHPDDHDHDDADDVVPEEGDLRMRKATKATAAMPAIRPTNAPRPVARCVRWPA